jgi:hypothetical protein
VRRFFLGTDRPGWLGTAPFPLFLSYSELRGRRSLPRAVEPWGLDSRGFTELSTHGRWTIEPEEYAEAALRFAGWAGNLAVVSPQDSMCEPVIFDVAERETGRRPTVAVHQEATTANLLELRALAPDLPWLPVLQGWEVDDYHRHVELYGGAGVDLTREPLVGVGSVCRRQDTRTAERIFVGLHAAGLRLHAFGVKTTGLSRYAWAVESADSFAWSYDARKRGVNGGEGRLLPTCTHRARTCAHCPDYAAVWRARVLARVATDQQTSLPV